MGNGMFIFIIPTFRHCEISTTSIPTWPSYLPSNRLQLVDWTGLIESLRAWKNPGHSSTIKVHSRTTEKHLQGQSHLAYLTCESVGMCGYAY